MADLVDLRDRAPVLLLGGAGMLGGAWRRLLDASGVSYAAPSSSELDLTDARAVDMIDERYRTVINCAGWTDVDGAESNESTAHLLNAEAPRRLAGRCAVTGAVLVHYSTDYVFNGIAIHPYSVTHRIAPINAYGRTKADGELAVMHSNADCLLIRTSWLYAPWGGNFVRTMLGLFRSRSDVRVVDDQTGRPTSVEHLAAASAELLARGVRGLWHVAGGGQCTWFDFAREIARLADADCRIRPCTTADFPRPAQRPPYSVLDLSATERVLGPMPEWQHTLTHVVSRILNRTESSAA